MITRSLSLKKSEAAGVKWANHQQKKKKIYSKLFKANKQREMKIKVMNNQVEIEPKTKDASTQTTTRTKSVSSQTEPRMKNASIQTTIETNSAEIQTQPQIKEVCVQTNKIKTVDAQTNTFVSNYSLPASPTFGGRPRKPVENLSTRRIEQLAKELADFHRERTPGYFYLFFIEINNKL